MEANDDESPDTQDAAPGSILDHGRHRRDRNDPDRAFPRRAIAARSSPNVGPRATVAKTEGMMPKPFDPNIEAQLQKMLERMKAREDAKNGPGAFDQLQRKGFLMMSKRADELTPEEAAFLDAPPPDQKQ